MKSWNTPDHRIADTEHTTLHFADGVEVVIADWQSREDAPDSDGRIYASLRGWLVNSGGSGRSDDPFTEPIEPGRARLIRVELRGRQPITDRNVHIDFSEPAVPYPNTWDHRGLLVTVSWMDRRIDNTGQSIPDDEIGRTEWTHPTTGKVFDLRAAYLPKGETYDPQFFTWQHYDGWRGGVPVLQPFYADAKAPSYGEGRLMTDGDWMLASEAPTFDEVGAAADAAAAARH